MKCLLVIYIYVLHFVCLDTGIKCVYVSFESWLVSFAVLVNRVKTLVLFALFLIGLQLVTLPFALEIFATILRMRELSGALADKVIIIFIAILVCAVGAGAFLTYIVTLAVFHVKHLALGTSDQSLVEVILRWEAQIVLSGV